MGDFMQNITYIELIDEYQKLIEEKYSLLTEYYLRYLKSINRLNIQTRNKLKQVFNKYLNSYKEYKIVLNFIVLNKNKIDYDNAIEVLDILNENYEELIPYLINLLDDYRIASELKIDYKFNVNNKYRFINKEDTINYLNYLKGFNVDYIKRFLIDKEVYSIDIIDDVYDIRQCVVKDELSTLINIYELVNKSLCLKKEEINNNKIINSEVLPIFYEMLYKKENVFCKANIHQNELANQLYKDYQNEPFNVQIKKLEKII